MRQVLTKFTCDQCGVTTIVEKVNISDKHFCDMDCLKKFLEDKTKC